ncbi:MAG: glycerate kinase, partial [Pseudobdellovibrionaceae bacterium]|nr:glycerate kinase [Pseudobdellovibrionaceae bacterium]
HGKLLSRVTELAQQYNVPVLAFCGALALDPIALKNCHIFPIIPEPCSLERALTEAPHFLYQTIQRVLALILSPRLS